MRREMLIAIVVGGLIAGFIDIGAASLITLLSPLMIMKAIAGGVLGAGSMKGGMDVSVLGFFLQLLMGVIIAAVYGIASLRLPMLVNRWLAWGLAYGVVIYFVMNYVVVPLSALHHMPHFPPKPVPFIENMAAMLVFGVIVAYAAYRGSRAPST